ncbi:Calx-beta domain-containing protein [Epsilonproteobacteria bacterium SCGC AD-311-C15]|jgi:hypothetical protein|nr:Calx-beta domain-containing protein [Epsilonproteobacteria bacterium SCGC AD-311-C15]
MKTFKLLPRLFAFFGLGIMFTVSGWAGDPYFSLTNPASVVEATGAHMDFNVTLWAAPSHSCVKNTIYSVNFETTTGGTSQAADFTAVGPIPVIITPTANINSGVCETITIQVPIFNDTFSEPDETVAARLIPGTNVNANIFIGQDSAAGIIKDDDTALTISVNDASIAEANTTVKVNVLLTLPAPIGGIQISYETLSSSPISAVSPADYNATATPISIIIPENANSYTINIPINDDILVEGTETFQIRITTTSGIAITKDTAKVTIFDNDSVSGVCSSYVGLITINEYQNNPNYFDITHYKIKGNYVELKYIDDLVKQHVGSDWNLSLYSTQTVVMSWDDRDILCTDPDYEIFQFDSAGMGAEAIVVLTDQNGNEVDLFNLNEATTYAQNCHSFVYDTNLTDHIAADKEFFRLPDGTGDWSNTGLGANSVGSRCLNIPGSGYELIYKQFDAIDDDEPLPTIVTGAVDVPLKTKITNLPFTVKILSLDTNTSGQIGQLQNITTTIKVYLAQGTGGSLLDPTGHLVTFTNQSYVTLSGLSLPKAVKNAKLWFEYCQDSTGVLHNWDTCFQTINVGWQRHSYSRNSFAIRPNDFNSTLPVGPFVAEQNTSLPFRADQYAGTGTTDYNETVNTSFAVDLNISDSTKTCPASSIQFTPNIVFANGLVTGIYSLNNVGDFNLTMHEINGSEFAHIDIDDTNDSARLITSFQTQIKVIPHHFLLEGNLTNAGNGFTYFSNFEAHPDTLSRNMSASLDMNITAKGEANATLSNYTSLCYANDGVITISLNPLNSPLNSNPDGNLTKLLWYENLHDLNGSVALPIATSYAMDMNKTQFNSTDTNGTATVKYLINFDRNQTKAVNPLLLNIQDINVTDTDAVPGNKTLDQNATFVYGRTHAPMYTFVGPTGDAFIYYESYLAGTGVKALLPNGNDSNSTDDPRWFKNTLHTATANGEVGNVTQKGGAGLVSLNGALVNPVGQTKAPLIYGTALNPAPQGYPYKTAMENNASSWLIYNKNDVNDMTNEFDVKFVNTGVWTGPNETNVTTRNRSSVITNRRSMW